MGFFSYNCRGCLHPLLAPHAVNAVNDWMNDCVCILSDGKIVMGSYDGYGRLVVNEWDDDVQTWVDGENPEAWHRACWEACGSPTVFTERSESADDQGHFFAPGAHDLPVAKAGIMRRHGARRK